MNKYVEGYQQASLEGKPMLVQLNRTLDHGHLIVQPEIIMSLNSILIGLLNGLMWGMLGISFEIPLTKCLVYSIITCILLLIVFGGE